MENNAYTPEQLLQILDAPRCEVCLHSTKWKGDQYRCNVIKDVVDWDYECDEFGCDLRKANLSNHRHRLQMLENQKRRREADGR